MEFDDDSMMQNYEKFMIYHNIRKNLRQILI